MYSSVPKLTQVPTLLYYAENDEMIPPTPYAHAYQALCETDVPIEYNICSGAGHSEGIQWSLPETFTWLEKRLAGESSGHICEYKEHHCCAGAPADIYE